MTARALVAGVGNVFFGDDAFGVEVARRLAAGGAPADVEVADYGIRGLHLAYRLLDGVELLLVADAMPRGGCPGTLYLVQPDLDAGAERDAGGAPDAHGMHLPAVFAAVLAMGGALPRVRIVGCEPADVGERLGLSPAVAKAVEPAVELVRQVLERELASAPCAREVVR